MVKRSTFMMKQLFLATALFATTSSFAQGLSYNERVSAYIQQYREWAQAEQVRTGVPAAITLAQGVFETNAGESELATQANNHFGIKCKREWTGATFAHDDDAPQECFRKYNSALESYKDHSDYLLTNKRYQSCFSLETTDYAGWAKELRRCGYATNPIYAQKLIKIIEEFHLQDYTLAALKPVKKPEVMIASNASPVSAALMADEKKSGEVVPEKDSPVEQPEYGHVVRKDGLKGFWARRGDVLLEYAIQYKVRYAKLLEINGLPDAPLANDQFIYLEKGNAVERIIAKDQSTPAPTPVASAASITPTSTKPAAPVLTASANSAPAHVQQTQPINATTPIAATTPVSKSEDLEEKATVSAATEQAITKQEVNQADEPINIAAESAVEVQKPAAEPEDEFSRLKARFDKVVYAPTVKPAVNTTLSSTNNVATPASPVQPEAVVSSVPVFHTVKNGETAFGIAKQYSISMQDLMSLNKLSFGTSINVGQKLRVK